MPRTGHYSHLNITSGMDGHVASHHTHWWHHDHYLQRSSLLFAFLSAHFIGVILFPDSHNAYPAWRLSVNKLAIEHTRTCATTSNSYDGESYRWPCLLAR